jgi:hypothetical protein
MWSGQWYITFLKRKKFYFKIFYISLKTRFLVARLEGFEPPADGSEVSLLEFFKKILATAIYPINALIIIISQFFVWYFLINFCKI